MQMPWDGFARSLAVIIFIQVLLGLYINRSMTQVNYREDNAQE